MTYEIRFHPDVESDLQTIAEVITDYSGFDTAKKKLEEIEQAVSKLSETPHKGSIRSDLAGNVRAIPAGRRGVVVFEVDDTNQTVYVLAITYGGADWISKLDVRYGGN